MKKIIHALYRLLRFRVQLKGVEHIPTSGAYIIASNHESYFDPGAIKIAVYSVTNRDVFFVTKEAISLTWRKLLGKNAYDILGMLPIINSDKGRVITDALEHLNNGGLVGIFPEGTRNKPSLNTDCRESFLKAKTGAARMALMSGVPVIPVSISAPAGIGLWQTLGNILAVWQPTKIEFLPAIQATVTPAPTKEELERWTTTLMTTIAAARGKRYPA